MDRRLTLGLLMSILLAHVVLSAMFAAATPYRSAGILFSARENDGSPKHVVDVGAPDERQHVNYVARLAKGDGFPVFNPHDPNLQETLESHQPPLYYGIAAIWCKVSGISDLENREQGLRLRAVNVAIGAATVSGVFFLAYWGFRREELALTAAAFCALLPMFCALSGAVNNDPLLICLCTWVVALCARAVRDGWSWRLAVLVGVLTGLALLTKTTALALVPVVTAACFLKQTHRPSPAQFLAAAAIALLLVAPWWARNQRLYGDPLALQAFNEAFTHTAQKSQIEAGILAQDPTANAGLSYWKDWVGWWTARSFFGVFGYMDIWLNEHGTPSTGPGAPNTIYRLLFAGFVLSAIGWALATTDAEFREARGVQILNALFIGTVLVLFLKFNAQYFQAQGRYLMPAIGSIACGVAIGIDHLLRSRRLLAFALITVLLLAVDVYALQRLPDEFSKRTLTVGTLNLPITSWVTA